MKGTCVPPCGGGPSHVSTDEGWLCENVCTCVKGNSIGSGKSKEWF